MNRPDSRLMEEEPPDGRQPSTMRPADSAEQGYVGERDQPPRAPGERQHGTEDQRQSER
jgi:hypothetical protein